ncbi:PadR family transcriptional regulator [Solibacillus cecembensis]|uniref:PadR family transcriptional regulator n=1 Tax=Solibacillus cecembensis TaxID=459347 RepID=UPI003D049808
MDKIFKKYHPMTETAFYILFSLTEPRHGYGIIKNIETLTNGRLKLGSGTIYGTLMKMQTDGLIVLFSDEERKTIYEMTTLGQQILQQEMKRIKELYDHIIQFEEGKE